MRKAENRKRSQSAAAFRAWLATIRRIFRECPSKGSRVPLYTRPIRANAACQTYRHVLDAGGSSQSGFDRAFDWLAVKKESGINSLGGYSPPHTNSYCKYRGIPHITYILTIFHFNASNTRFEASRYVKEIEVDG